MADGVLTDLVGREGGSSRSEDDDLVDGGCEYGSLRSGSGSGSALGDFGFSFAPPIFPIPLEGFCWAFCGSGKGDFGGSGSGFFES